MNNEKKDEMIVRQSSLKFVGDYTKTLGTPLTLAEIIGITNVISDYCLNGYNKDVKDRLNKIDEYLLKKFSEE